MLFLMGKVFAANPPPITIAPPTGFTGIENITLEKVISVGIQIIIIGAVLVAFVFLMIGGVKWITAGANKEAAADARGTLTAAIVGLVIIFLAWAVITFVGNIFGIDILANLKFPQLQ